MRGVSSSASGEEAVSSGDWGGVASAGAEAGALPDAARHHDLGPLAGGQVGADQHQAVGAVRPELEHLDRVAQVEVEDLVGGQPMHGRERVRGQQVVDRGADRATGGQPGVAAVGLDELAALDRMGHEPEEGAQGIDAEHAAL